VVLYYPAQRIPENSEPKDRDVKLKTLFSAAALALLAACSGDSTGPNIPALTPLPAGVTVVTLDSGLRYADITVGSGALAQSGSHVAVHYTGWLADGTGFDTSGSDQTLPLTLGAHEVIPGFEDGILGMKVGGKRRLFVPAALGYGSTAVYDQKGKVIIPANADLIFDVELVSVQ
jgi:FKBP-type peptidyl-prolyl cis-trans isomerase